VRATPRVALDSTVRAAERQLIRAMVQERGLVDAVAERWPPSDFHTDAYRELFARLVDDPQRPLDDATRDFPTAAVRLLDEALGEPDPTPGLTVDGWLVKLQVWAMDQEKGRLLAELQAPDAPLADARKDEINRRLTALQRERAALSPSYARVGRRPADPSGAPDAPGSAPGDGRG
jgi:hypothetical protein